MKETIITNNGEVIELPDSDSVDDYLTIVPHPNHVSKKYFYQTDPADGQVYIYENNWSDKLGECLVTITKPEVELSLEEQEFLKDRR